MGTTIREWSRRDECMVERDTLTAGEARAMLDEERLRNGPEAQRSRVNRGLSKHQALDILERAFSTQSNDEPIASIIAGNVLRECGRRPTR